MYKFIAPLFCLVMIFAQSSLAQDKAPTFDSPVSSVVVVPFPDSSTTFQPSAHQAAFLGDANQAALIAIRGRTSTKTPSVRDERLALERALSARSYLISRGVSPLKISVNFASAADFIADNSTPEGRLENQRVEVELIYVRAFPE